MKKILFNIISVITILLIIGACSKDFNKQDNLEVNQYSSIEQRILKFKSVIENEGLNYKAGINYLLDTAVWNIEALANYTYADVSQNLENLFSYTCYVDATTSNDSISSSDVTSLYNQLIDSLESQYDGIRDTVKHLVFVDISLDTVISSTATFGMRSAFVAGSTYTPSFNDPFGTEEWWFWAGSLWNGGGYCAGIYEGTHTDSDAAEEIEKIVRYKAPPDIWASLLCWGSRSVLLSRRRYYN